jgi:serine protease Do
MVTRRLAILLLAGALAACGGDGTASAQQSASPRPQLVASHSLAAQRQTAIVDATARVAPAVVSVRVVLPQPQPSPWDLFNGMQTGTPESFGTGFILRADGIIVTNQHVVDNGQQITVTLSDGTDLPGTVLGEDPLTDIAVIKVDRTDLPVAPIGHSSDLMIGEWAIALGNPYTYLLGNSEPTVTAGVISATHRNIVPNGQLAGEYLDMIQTDAAINPGNSGGPLVNALGEVIGVNSSILSNTGESVGLGFAIPIERAVRVADDIIRHRTVRRAWVGLEVAGANEMSDWKRSGGIRVTQVLDGGPADKAGLRVGDILVSANGRTLRNYLDWEAVKLDLRVGDSIAVQAATGGRSAVHRIIAGDLPTMSAQRISVAGLELVTLTPGVRAQFGAQSTAGAAISRIPNDLANETGLQAGDVILGIGNVPIHQAEDFQRVFGQIRSGSAFRLYVERKGTVFNIVLQKP